MSLHAIVEERMEQGPSIYERQNILDRDHCHLSSVSKLTGCSAAQRVAYWDTGKIAVKFRQCFLSCMMRRGRVELAVLDDPTHRSFL